MISGAHILLYSSDPEVDRAFFRDVLGLRYVDDGGGWLIFALPPSEIAVHPLSENAPAPSVDTGHQLVGASVHLMCDDLASVIKSLKSKKIGCTEPSTQPWGMAATVRLPAYAQDASRYRFDGEFRCPGELGLGASLWRGVRL